MIILSLMIAYLLGSIPVGYLMVKWKEGEDVREVGSGATGATNVLRKAGKAAGIVTLILDAAKGLAAVRLAGWLTQSGGMMTWAVAAAAVMAIIGHIFPVWLGFRAGKGVATGVGVFLAVSPLAVLSSLVIFAIIVKTTRYVSLGSVVAAATTPLWAWFWNGVIFPRPDLAQILTALCAVVVLIVAKHTPNIRRLITGRESKLGAAH
jgi:glycerol-3-phosphate acyltransferase PlsY